MPRDADAESAPAEHPFAGFVRTLGRGPGRSRALTREEARTALGMVLRGEADPHQVGAFLMLLRYRGEDPEEMAGLVEAAREEAGCGGTFPLAVDLDWPSYGAGKTRGAPWFLLAALALGQAGYRVLMHGTNEFSAGMPVAEALPLLGLHTAAGRADAQQHLQETGFAYLPLETLAPGLDRLIRLRGLLGLRSPINTAVRLLDPCDARCGVDGVFHPPYVAVHLATAERLGRRRLVVVKGGGGEAERTPLKPVAAHVYDRSTGVSELALPASSSSSGRASEDLVTVWRGGAEGMGLATVLATIELALLALNPALSPDALPATARNIWAGRRVG